DEPGDARTSRPPLHRGSLSATWCPGTLSRKRPVGKPSVLLPGPLPAGTVEAEPEREHRLPRKDQGGEAKVVDRGRSIARLPDRGLEESLQTAAPLALPGVVDPRLVLFGADFHLQIRAAGKGIDEVEAIPILLAEDAAPAVGAERLRKQIGKARRRG